jgi:putative Holliday junction resolvase
LHVPRILAIDYGLKRTGIAVTDPLKIIATGLTTIESPQLFKFLKEYTGKESVERFIIGFPRNLDGTETDASRPVLQVIEKLNKQFPQIPITQIDERFTSKMASRAMVDMGMRKKERRDKSLVDMIAATLMLQEFLQRDSG